MKAFIRYDVTKFPDNYAEFPYRDVALIEFFKKVKEKNDVIAIYLDEDSKSISFVVPSCSDTLTEGEK